MKEFVGYDSWKRPVYRETVLEVESTPEPSPTPEQPHVNNYVEATPEDVKEWQNGGDFFMTGKFDAMKLFVVVPAIIQIMAMAMMGAVMFLNTLLF
tara:strand:+ start:373 stop:660 length:288 start_codon:yes stop_codon:yes gene_type:complete